MPRDKTRPYHDQKQIQVERDRLQAIIDSMDDGISIVGRDYRVKFMNRALQNEMGDGMGQLCYEFFGHDQLDCEYCQCGIGSFGPQFRREWFSQVTQKTYDMVISPLHLPDGEIARLHILRDITEKKELLARLQEYSQNLEVKVAEQAETLRRKDRLALLGEISAGLAHQIRTPLGAIITGIKLLEKGGQSPQERNLVFDLLKKETTRLERKVSEFLSYARPQPPQYRETDIGLLFQEVRSILSVNPEQLGNVSIEFLLPSDLPHWPMDAEQIKEVLLNLGTNALWALKGKGKLIFQAKRSGDVFEILVRDNGPGISSDTLPHIFKPFYTRRSEGTGLGLSICQQIIESHGGHIVATSIPHVQTTFKIILPDHS
jgi:signal transduction histidine kinase